MKTDMLYWSDLYINVKYVDTKKKFFNRYLYKTIVYAPATNIISSKSKSPAIVLLKERQDQHAYFKNMNRHWANHKQDRNLNDASWAQLDYFKDAAQKHKGQIKYRSEEPYLSIYADDPQLLFDIVSQSPMPNRLTEVHRPANADAEAALNRGEVIVKKFTEYNYKVMFRDGYSFADDNQVCDYLYNLGDDVKMTKSCLKTLSGKRYWYSGIYFYCKDPDITTFLNLIAPGSISGIYKLTRLDE